MASSVEIANRALQSLGAKRITSLTEDSVSARAINTAFESVKLGELRAHPWSFAVKRASIGADVTAPIFGKDNFYTLPSDFVRLLDPDPDFNVNSRDWQVEGKKIATDDTAPLEIRYIYDVTDPNEMDPLFREAFSAKLALELCEELTQSNSKKQAASDLYDRAISKARKANAFERVGQRPMTDTWETVRRT